MKYIALCAIFITSIFANSSVEEGRELYLEAKCQKCHLQDEKFDPNSLKKEGLSFKSKSIKDIHKWVVNCNEYFSVGWFPEEEDKVTEYLNKVFYKFKSPKKEISK